MLRAVSILGIFALIGLAWLMSSHRKKFPWRVVLGSLGLQFGLTLFMLKTSVGQWFFREANTVVSQLMSFVDAGTKFVFTMRRPQGDMPPLEDLGLIYSFAFGVLPTIVFFSALMAILYHIGIMQVLVKSIAWVMQKTLRTSGPETMSVAANIFFGQTEAPLVVKPYLSKMTRSELNALMTGGFATVTGSLLGAYTRMGANAGDLITACVISAPAALMISKLMEPETEPEKVSDSLDMAAAVDTPNLIGAATQGASDGLKLALNVGAMLIAFLALIAMCDWFVGSVGMLLGYADPKGNPIWSLSATMSYLFWPFAWLMGIATEDCLEAGRLLGIKMVTNEFIAYEELGQLLRSDGGPKISERTARIMTYALCGFANFSSIGIQVGGIGGLAPDRKNDLAKLGLRAMIGGTIACLMTGCFAGIFIA